MFVCLSVHLSVITCSFSEYFPHFPSLFFFFSTAKYFPPFPPPPRAKYFPPFPSTPRTKYFLSRNIFLLFLLLSEGSSLTGLPVIFEQIVWFRIYDIRISEKWPKICGNYFGYTTSISISHVIITL